MIIISKRKWAKGRVVTSLEEFNKQEYIWFYDKVYHRGWFQNWQYARIIMQINSRNIYEVVPVKHPAKIIKSEYNNLHCSICKSTVSNSTDKYCSNCGTRLHGFIDCEETTRNPQQYIKCGLPYYLGERCHARVEGGFCGISDSECEWRVKEIDA